MSSPLVSVALCTCNGEAYIEAQLASVLAQTHRELELVVVDDASTDRTVEIVEEAARRDQRIQLHRNPERLGVNANFARAFSLCRGDFIAPCDQDDVWSARKLETLMAAIGDADLAYGDSAVVDAEGRPTGQTLGGQRRMLRGQGNVALAFENSVSGHAALFRNTLLPQALPFPEGVWYDGWLAFAASQRAGVVYVDEVMVDFRRHAESLADELARPAQGPRAQRSDVEPGAAHRVAEGAGLFQPLGDKRQVGPRADPHGRLARRKGVAVADKQYLARVHSTRAVPS